MKTTVQTLAVLAFAAAVTTPALAAGSHADHDHSTPEGMAQHMQMMQSMPGMQAASPTAAAGRHETDGVVRKIDAAASKITLRHGPIPNLGMGAMTMGYQVKDKAMLDGLKDGDAVRFTAERVDGVYTVTHLERTR